jgi:protein-L-isoaspartate O-methyltransferase
LAHSDQPLKEENIHISAPHIYGTALEALELTPDTGLSFLNLGSGTAYLSAMVATILGPTHQHLAIELRDDVIQHAHSSLARWGRLATKTATKLPPIEILKGNALFIDDTLGEARFGFDRIYVGAAVEKEDIQGIANLLRPGGILVGPVDDELVKIVRVSQASSPRPQPPRSIRGHPPALTNEFTMQVLSGVRFVQLSISPPLSVVIPSLVWDPSIHHRYPESFRKSCKAILLCSHAPMLQPPLPAPRPRINAASKLPRALWMEILSYTHRDWFAPPRSEEAFLRARLEEEQEATRRAQKAREDTETRLHMAERERDIYRTLALRWQSRLRAITRSGVAQLENPDGDDPLIGVDDISQAASIALVQDPSLRMGGLRSMFRQFQQDSSEEEETASEAEGMEDVEQEAMEETESASQGSEETESTMAASPPASSQGIEARSQARTVSF